LNFRVKFKLDRRGTKNQDGSFDENTVCPIKVNLHSIESNRNYDFSIKDIVFDDGSRIKLEATSIDFDSLWVNREKKDSFGEVVGETTVYGRKAEIKAILKAKQNILEEIISRNGITDYVQVKKLFNDYKKPNQFIDDVYLIFNKKVESLIIRESHKSAQSVENTCNNIRAYNLGLSFRFSEITKDWLKGYERKRRINVSVATVGVDLRNLRTIFNLAIEKNPSLKEIYPFGKGKYQIPTGDSKNVGLNKQDLKKIQDFTSDNHYLQMARDYFMFSYYANGMNLKDIAKLKKNQTEYVRSKTEFTSKKEKRISLDLNEIQQEIIKRHKGKGDSLFNILEDGDTGATITKKVNNKTSAIAKQMKNLAKKLDLPKELSYQWARHSYATNMFRDKVNFKAISESLGHSSLKTTENYIDSLVDENKKAIEEAKKL